MTITELKNKILESAEPNWFNTVKETFSFDYINLEVDLEGLTAIYQFLNQQIHGWEEIGTTGPQLLSNSLSYFTNIRNQIDIFLNTQSHQPYNSLVNQWSIIRNIINSRNNCPLTYDCPETEFFLKIQTIYPKSFEGAFAFITRSIYYNISDPDTLIGVILAYEFRTKENSSISNRRIAENNSLNKVKKDLYKYLSDSETQLSNHLLEATSKYKEYIHAIDNMTQQKEKLFNDWYENSKTDFNTFSKNAGTTISDLEKTYEELLRLKKPAEYWNLRATELKKEGWRSLYWLIGLVSIGFISLYFLLWQTPEGMLKTFFSNDKSIAIRWSIIFVTFLSFLAFGIRALTKVTFSSFHLARDAEERERLTFVYLALIKDASIDKSDRQLIMQSLFSRADTGLLKDDSSPTMPGTNSFIDKIIK